MNQKTKLELLKDKILSLKNKKVEDQYTTLGYIEPKEPKVMKNIVTGALVASLAVTSTIGINEFTVNHATDMCIASKIISIFDEQAAIEHQILGIKSNFVNAENLSVEYKDAYYRAPDGYELKGDKAVKYIEPTKQVIYSVPAGYVLQGTKGVKINSDGTKEEVDATVSVRYCLPEGGILTTDSDGNTVGYQEIAAEYHEPAITTTTDEETYTLKLKR